MFDADHRLVRRASGRLLGGWYRWATLEEDGAYFREDLATGARVRIGPVDLLLAHDPADEAVARDAILESRYEEGRELHRTHPARSVGDHLDAIAIPGTRNILLVSDHFFRIVRGVASPSRPGAPDAAHCSRPVSILEDDVRQPLGIRPDADVAPDEAGDLVRRGEPLHRRRGDDLVPRARRRGARLRRFDRLARREQRWKNPSSCVSTRSALFSRSLSPLRRVVQRHRRGPRPR